MQMLKEGDEQVFEQIYHRWYKPVYGFMLKTTHSNEDAEDIAQEAFARLWKMRDKIDSSGNIQALIFIIARRAAVDMYRRSERTNGIFAGGEQLPDEHTSLECSSDSSPEEILEASETRLLLQIAIGQMPKKQREIFSLHYYENLSTAEIASQLGLSPENVRRQIWNGKHQLRDVISLMLIFLLGEV
jgi:RNA polymerase sigma-70 factor (ECF subfamily)